MNSKPIIKIFVASVLFFSSCKHDTFQEEMAIVVNETPTNINNNNTGSSCDPDTVYFVNDILPIINSNCAFKGCHGDGSAKEGVDLSSYDLIISTGKIMAFNPGESKLYKAITEKDIDEIMPPDTVGQLSADQKAKIRKWIEQGALDNFCEGCDTTSVTFQATIFPIIQNNCEGCHSGSSPRGGIALTDYSQIEASALSGKLYGAVNHEAGYVAMPYRQSKLDQCKIDQIRIWIENGALND